MTTRFVVAGAGLGGSLMAILLGRAGYEVEVVERRPDPRATGGAEGRSINLAISTRGIHALTEAGVWDAVAATAVPMRGRMMHDERGRLAFQPYGTRPEHVINSVSRAGLNALLVEAADALANVSFRFEERVDDVDLDEATLHTVHATTGASGRVEGDVLIGADGAFSAVRTRMSKLDRFDFQQSYLAHGYKELAIPPGPKGAFRLANDALHIWPRGGFMMIALPNRDGSFTNTLFWPFEGANSFDRLRTPEDVQRFFTAEFPDAVPHLEDLSTQYLTNPTSSLVTVRCGPWYYGDRVVLLGDACHAVVPFYGQGANAAFEDCSVLAACLAERPSDRAAAFRAYYERRKEHADALADLAVANFYEMRDHVGHAGFRLRKRLEKVLHRAFPWWFLPLYSMITFSRIPYADAVRRARRQRRVLGWAAAIGVLGATVLGWWLWN